MPLAVGEHHDRLLRGSLPDVRARDAAERALGDHVLAESLEALRFEAFRKNMIAKGAFGSISRAYIGKGTAQESIVMLADRQGHPRIKMMVDSLGTPSLRFLDADGHVTQQLPESH